MANLHNGKCKGRLVATKSMLSSYLISPSITDPRFSYKLPRQTSWYASSSAFGRVYFLTVCFHVIGVLNEGGTFGERKGWHLPSFSTSNWASRPLTSGLPGGPGIGFFVTTLNLNLNNVDAMMSFTFTEPLGQSYRALLFVNGWMMGKRVGNVG